MSTWIWLRGLARESRHWGTFPELFERELPGTQIIAIDLPGNGRFHELKSPANVAGMTAHCRAELMRLGARPPYRLLAMSMGAMVATDWARQHPAEIERSVLINTSFAGFSSFTQRLRRRAWPSLVRIAASGSAKQKEQEIFCLTSNLPEMPDTLIAEWVAIRRSHPVSLANTVRQLWAASRFRAPPRAPAHTLALTSDGDRLVDTRCSREIAQRWHCAIAIHPRAGHDLPLDEPVWVAARIREWLIVLDANLKRASGKES